MKEDKEKGEDKSEVNNKRGKDEKTHNVKEIEESKGNEGQIEGKKWGQNETQRKEEEE